MNNKPSDAKPNDGKAAKKNYCAPNLLVYGTIREVTQAVDNKGNTDGGKGSNDKT